MNREPTATCAHECLDGRFIPERQPRQHPMHRGHSLYRGLKQFGTVRVTQPVPGARTGRFADQLPRDIKARQPGNQGLAFAVKFPSECRISDGIPRSVNIEHARGVRRDGEMRRRSRRAVTLHGCASGGRSKGQVHHTDYDV